MTGEDIQRVTSTILRAALQAQDAGGGAARAPSPALAAALLVDLAAQAERAAELCAALLEEPSAELEAQAGRHAHAVAITALSALLETPGVAETAGRIEELLERAQ